MGQSPSSAISGIQSNTLEVKAHTRWVNKNPVTEADCPFCKKSIRFDYDSYGMGRVTPCAHYSRIEFCGSAGDWMIFNGKELNDAGQAKSILSGEDTR
jgi:hypothetical protein